MRYILKRLLFMIPTLLLLVVAGFLLIESAPFNPEELQLASDVETTNQNIHHSQQEFQKRQWRKQYGLDLPVFYIRITHLADIDTLPRMVYSSDRQLIKQLLVRNGNTTAVLIYYQSLKDWIRHGNEYLQRNKKSAWAEPIRQTHALALSLNRTWDPVAIKSQINRTQKIYDSILVEESLKKSFYAYKSAFENLNENALRWKTWIPSLRFYPKNRFHCWLFGNGKDKRGIIKGDFGISWYNQRPVLPYLLPKLFWSVLLTFISVIMAYIVAVPLGLAAAGKANGLFDRLLQSLLLILYSVPTFLAAIVLLRTFSNPEVLAWFPTGGISPIGGFNKSVSYLQQVIQTIPYLVLPVIAYTYSSIVIITQLTRERLLQEADKAYILTARAKGLTKNKIFWRHLLRNSLLPLITLFSQVFPASVAGSVVIESVFSVPGMGQETLLAVFQMNYPVLATIIVLSGMFTITGYLISDILYVIADPLIRLNKKQTD